MKTKLSRRAALAGLATLTPAAASVAVPAAATDAELIDVSSQLLDLYERRDALDAQLFPLVREYWDRMETACKERGFSDVRRGEGSKAANDLIRALEEQVRQTMPPWFNTANTEVESLTSRLEAPARQIMALPARTPRGLALKAVFTAYENTELWQRAFNDLDWHEMFLRNLIESVLAFAGAPLPFERPIPYGAPHPDRMGKNDGVSEEAAA